MHAWLGGFGASELLRPSGSREQQKLEAEKALGVHKYIYENGL